MWNKTKNKNQKSENPNQSGKSKFIKYIFAAVIALVFNSAYSQAPDQWTRTLQLEGYWEGPATLNLGGEIFNITYHTDFNTILNGIGMSMKEGFTDATLGELKGANLIGLNAADGLIHWSSVDNFGTAHEHTGSWLNPKHFFMEHHSLQGGQAYAEYIDIKLRANNHKVLVSLVATLDADTIEILTGILFRQNNNRSINGNFNQDLNNEISIYPNPTRGNFEITSSKIINEIKIRNETGQLIYHSKPNDTDISIDLDRSGIYFLEIISDNHIEMKKIVISK